MVMFQYYLLGGDTAAPSGLYARLFHAFLVFLNNLAHSAKLQTGLYIILMVVLGKGLMHSFGDRPRDVAMATN